jgi:RimJ/RimL family protein N-acetyltransferase
VGHDGKVSDTGISVRAAHPADGPGLARLDASAWSPESGFPSVLRRMAGEPFFSDDNPPEAHLVALVGGKLAGYVRLRPVTSLPEHAHVLGIFGIAVAPAARRRGAGSALLAAAEDHARARGAHKLSLRVLSTNKVALRLYERHGFRTEGLLRDEFLINGRYVHDVIMAKSLT